uniref:Uncharacterized protein n=1 Tax=Arundo donax TaxID=35708 RepID=A0A0A9EA63_ARUDO
MIVMYLPLFARFWERHTLRMRSTTAICSRSGHSLTRSALESR